MHPFFKIPTTIQTKEILEFVKDKKASWLPYYNFDSCYIPHSFFKKIPFYNTLYKHYPFQGGVLKMKPHTIYNWHTDSNRGVCINCLLQHKTSYTYFRNAKEVHQTILPLKYELHVPYLFNNQIEHMVLNVLGTRYVLTIEFLEDKDTLSYKDLFDKTFLFFN